MVAARDAVRARRKQLVRRIGGESVALRRVFAVYNTDILALFLFLPRLQARKRTAPRVAHHVAYKQDRTQLGVHPKFLSEIAGKERAP